MAKLAELLNQRFRKKEKPKEAPQQDLTLFSGAFHVDKMPEQEEANLAELLQAHIADESVDYDEDLRHLLAITSEVKAINNQAAILHGERIKRAQEILKKYKEGAFTTWLKSTYGNRQTPYNFLQYYLFYHATPKELRVQMESMPRQAIYTLASRQGELEKKLEIVEGYQGETKLELLSVIRASFPLDEKDRRRENLAESALKELSKVTAIFEKNRVRLSPKQKSELLNQLKLLQSLVNSSDLV